jgi:hypothetical protein
MRRGEEPIAKWEIFFMSQLDENFKKLPVIFPVIREFGPGLFPWATISGASG